MGRKIRPELDKFRDQTVAKADEGVCEGGCDEHRGAVKAVRVFGSGGEDWGYFSYCENACSEDTENRGMTLENA